MNKPEALLGNLINPKESTEKQDKAKNTDSAQQSKPKKNLKDSSVVVVLSVVICSLVILLIFVTTSSRTVYVPEKKVQAQTTETAESETLLPGGKYVYYLGTGEATGWKNIPGNCVYDVRCDADQPMFRIYYSDGTVVDFTDGINKELPRKTLAKFRVVSLCDQRLTIEVMARKIKKR